MQHGMLLFLILLWRAIQECNDLSMAGLFIRLRIWGLALRVRSL